MCKIIDIRSIKGDGYIEAPKEPAYANPSIKFPIENTLHGITYDIFITSDHTVYIRDLETGKIHTIKTLISLYNTDDIAILKNNVYYLNGTNSVKQPEYFHSLSINTRTMSRMMPEDDTMYSELEDVLDLMDVCASDMSKDFIFEPILFYQGGKLRYTMVLHMDYNRVDNMDCPLGYNLVISNCTRDPKKVLFGYFYLLTDYPFPFIIEKEFEPVLDSNSHLTGIKIPFNLGPNSVYDVSEVMG